MEVAAAEMIGTINIVVYKTSSGDSFFKLQSDDEDLLPLLDIIENTLVKY